MDLVSLTVGLPLTPLRLVLALARVLEEEADRQLHDPSRVRQEIEEIEAAQADEQVPDEVAEAGKEELVGRLTRR